MFPSCTIERLRRLYNRTTRKLSRLAPPPHSVSFNNFPPTSLSPPQLPQPMSSYSPSQQVPSPPQSSTAILQSDKTQPTRPMPPTHPTTDAPSSPRLDTLPNSNALPLQIRAPNVEHHPMPINKLHLTTKSPQSAVPTTRQSTDDTPITTFKASCVRKTRRATPGVNVGICTLTTTAFRFTADFLVANPSEAILTLPLQHITLVRRASFRRILPNAILVRCRNFPEYLFAFESARDQMRALHCLELSVHDATTSTIVVPSLHPPKHPSSSRPDSLDSQLSEEHHLSSEDHSSCEPNSHTALNGKTHLLDIEPISLPAASRAYNPHSDPNASLRSIPRSHSHPGDSTTSLTALKHSAEHDDDAQTDSVPDPSCASSEAHSVSTADHPPERYLFETSTLKLQDNAANRKALVLAYIAALTVVVLILLAVFIHLNRLSTRIMTLTSIISDN